jgi:hypothetical protein
MYFPSGEYFGCPSKAGFDAVIEALRRAVALSGDSPDEPAELRALLVKRDDTEVILKDAQNKPRRIAAGDAGKTCFTLSYVELKKKNIDPATRPN